MENHKNRKLNRLKEYDYSQDGWYFITICAKDRQNLFGEITEGEIKLSEIGEVARKCWQEIPIHFPDVKLDEFIVMPNHIHGIIVIENKTADVGNNNYCSENGNKTVGNNNYCSENANKTVGNNNYCSENGNKIFCSLQWQTKWARSLSSIVRGFKIGVTKWRRENVWQKSYYDHIIRNENSLNKIREYIKNNPLKWEADRNNAENLWM